MKVIRSRENPLFRSLAKLADSARARRQGGMTLLEGAHLVEAWREAGLGPAEVVAASEASVERDEVRGVLDATPARTKIVLADALFRRLSQVVTPSGVLAAVRIPAAPAMPPRVRDAVYLERVQDPGNLGTVLRTTLAAGIREVFLSPGSVVAWSPKVVRAAMGAHFGLRIVEDADLNALVRLAEGPVIATAPDARRSLYEADLRRPVLWMFGNEGEGLSPEAVAQASERVRIPMPGPVESLNLAASAAVCLFEQARRRLGA